jgi:hypothetical protein
MKDLVGKTVAYYGADGNRFKLDDTIYEVIEDEEDGYRSSLQDIAVVKDAATLKSLILSGEPLAYVKVVEVNEEDGLEGYRLEDTIIKHVWGEVGTNHYDSYYPYFVSVFTPIAIDQEYERLNEGRAEFITGAVHQALVRKMAEGKRIVQRKRRKNELERRDAKKEEKQENYSDNPTWGSW